MSFQGSLIGWVADHRRHHRYADRSGDPHSPLWVGDDTGTRAAAGCGTRTSAGCFSDESTSRERVRARPARRSRPRAHRQAVRAVLHRDARAAVRDRLPLDRHGRRRCRRAAVRGGDPGRASATTSRGRSTRSATASATVRSRHATRAPTSRRSRCSRWASRGTTTTTRSRAAPATASTPASSTRPAACIRLFERFGWVTNVQWPDPTQIAARRAPGERHTANSTCRRLRSSRDGAVFRTVSVDGSDDTMYLELSIDDLDSPGWVGAGTRGTKYPVSPRWASTRQADRQRTPSSRASRDGCDRGRGGGRRAPPLRTHALRVRRTSWPADRERVSTSCSGNDDARRSRRRSAHGVRVRRPSRVTTELPTELSTDESERPTAEPEGPDESA